MIIIRHIMEKFYISIIAYLNLYNLKTILNEIKLSNCNITLLHHLLSVT